MLTRACLKLVVHVQAVSCARITRRRHGHLPRPWLCQRGAGVRGGPAWGLRHPGAAQHRVHPGVPDRPGEACGLPSHVWTPASHKRRLGWWGLIPAVPLIFDIEVWYKQGLGLAGGVLLTLTICKTQNRPKI